MAKLSSGTRIYGSATVDTTLSVGTSASFTGSTSGSITLQATGVAGTNTLTLPATTSTIATLTGTETLTNKTLSSSILTGTLTAGGTTGTNGQVLQSTGSGVQWATASGASNLDSLTDVVITTPSSGQVLKYNGTNWINDTDSTGGASNLDSLTDVVITTPSSGQVLKYNGTNWINDTDSTGGSSTLTISNKTGAYTVVAGDLGTIINCTSGTFTVSLTAAATLGAGFNCWIWNTGTGTITIDPSGAETIEEVATVALSPGEGFNIVCTGTSFIAGDQKAHRLYSEDIDNGFALRPVASGTGSVAIGAQSTATAAYSMAFRGNSTISYGTAIGANSSNQRAQAVTGSGAMALGGSYASGTDSFAASITNNTSSYGAKGTNSIAIGYQARAEFYGIAIGREATASGGSTAIAIGRTVTASDEYTYAFGMEANSSIKGKFAFASFGATGTYQSGLYIQRTQTTDNVAKVLNFEGTTSYANSQVILPNNSAYAFTGTVVARQQASGGTASAAWKIEGLIRREANAASTVLVNYATTVIDNTPGWTLALSADTTNGGLAITATGAASTNIRWVATVQTSEVIYA
jgi:hypothetical protein